MSQENMETSSDAIAALNRDGVEGFLAYCDPDVEWITPPDWPEDPVFNGHDGVRRAIALFGEQLDDFHVEIERVVDVDKDRRAALSERAHQGQRSHVEGASRRSHRVP